MTKSKNKNLSRVFLTLTRSFDRIRAGLMNAQCVDVCVFCWVCNMLFKPFGWTSPLIVICILILRFSAKYIHKTKSLVCRWKKTLKKYQSTICVMIVIIRIPVNKKLFLPILSHTLVFIFLKMIYVFLVISLSRKRLKF